MEQRDVSGMSRCVDADNTLMGRGLSLYGNRISVRKLFVPKGFRSFSRRHPVVDNSHLSLAFGARGVRVTAHVEQAGRRFGGRPLRLRVRTLSVGFELPKHPPTDVSTVVIHVLQEGGVEVC